MNRRRLLTLLGIAPVALPAIAATAVAPSRGVSRFARLAGSSIGPEQGFTLGSALSPGEIIDFHGSSVERLLADQAADKAHGLIADHGPAALADVGHHIGRGEPVDAGSQVADQRDAAIGLAADQGEEQRSNNHLQRHVVGGQLGQSRVIGADRLVVTGHFGSPFVARSA